MDKAPIRDPAIVAKIKKAMSELEIVRQHLIDIGHGCVEQHVTHVQHELARLIVPDDTNTLAALFVNIRNSLDC